MTSISRIYNELNVSEINLNDKSKKRAVIFGGARFKPEDKYYKLTYDIAKMLGHSGYDVMTGGGPGIMEAGNKGCFEEGTSNAIGLNIYLDFEQQPNPYQNITLHYESFLSRKYAFFKNTDIFIVMPGGFGTLDELFEALTLIQCKKIRKVPIVLVDSYFYAPLVEFIKEMLLKQGTISKEDLDLLTMADSVDEIGRLI